MLGFITSCNYSSRILFVFWKITILAHSAPGSSIACSSEISAQTLLPLSDLIRIRINVNGDDAPHLVNILMLMSMPPTVFLFMHVSNKGLSEASPPRFQRGRMKQQNVNQTANSVSLIKQPKSFVGDMN